MALVIVNGVATIVADKPCVAAQGTRLGSSMVVNVATNNIGDPRTTVFANQGVVQS